MALLLRRFHKPGTKMSGLDRTLLAATLRASAGSTLGDGQPRRRLMARFLGSAGGGSEGVMLKEEKCR